MAKNKKTKVSSEVVTNIFIGTITIGNDTFEIWDDKETSARTLILKL